MKRLFCFGLLVAGILLRACGGGQLVFAQTTVISIPTPAGTHIDPKRPGVAIKDVCPTIPLPIVAGTEKICHQAYVAFYDADLELPRLVAYELTGPHTLGCVPRASGFHAEGDSAKPGTYSGTGYDLGHMDPAQDNAWANDVSHDSFSTINIAPQLPGLNRQEWERLEEDVRAWALDRGDLLVYVGPVLGAHPKTLDKIAIPMAFFKIIVDRKTGDVLAFEMPQKDIPKGDVEPWRTTISQIRADTGIQFRITQNAAAPLWPADLAGWHKAHKQACGK